MSGSFGASRFRIFRRQVDGLAQKTLTQCLRRLERNGIIERRLIDARRPALSLG
jgi:DNA-binding HxlR family transcriptional regulator